MPYEHRVNKVNALFEALCHLFSFHFKDPLQYQPVNAKPMIVLISLPVEMFIFTMFSPTTYQIDSYVPSARLFRISNISGIGKIAIMAPAMAVSMNDHPKM